MRACTHLEELRSLYHRRRQQSIIEELMDVITGFEVLGDQSWSGKWANLLRTVRFRRATLTFGTDDKIVGGRSQTMMTPEAFRATRKERELHRLRDVPGEEYYGRDRKSLLVESASSANHPVVAGYLISRYTFHSLEPFCFSAESGIEVLPVFPSEEIADKFLRSYVTGEGWYVREFSAGELISVLYGPCAHVGEVLLYPLAECAPVRAVRRKGFVDDFLMARNRNFLRAKTAREIIG